MGASDEYLRNKQRTVSPFFERSRIQMDGTMFYDGIFQGPRRPDEAVDSGARTRSRARASGRAGPAAVPAAPTGGRRAGLGACRPGDRGVGVGGEGAESVRLC